MSPRRYRADKRKAAAEETRRRILEAVVALHADRGVTSTSYAMIAERADVAIPTVYNHFPKLDDLLVACFGYTTALAPPLGPQIFERADDLESRIRALVAAVFAFYRFRGRWLRWTYYEAKTVPPIDAMLKKASDGRRSLIDLALAPAFGQRSPAALLALYEILLDFPAWQRLTSDASLAGGEAETMLAETLVALAREHGANDPSTEARTEAKPVKGRTKR